jgi:hypothetical protein
MEELRPAITFISSKTISRTWLKTIGGMFETMNLTYWHASFFPHHALVISIPILYIPALNVKKSINKNILKNT